MISRPQALRRLVVSTSFFALALFALPVIGRADALQHTFVSGVGDDVNPGNRWAPCKTFAGAIAKTAAGGVITVLDPGGFGTVTITKAITIEGDDQDGSILASGTNGINVNAGPTDIVTIRHLNIDGAGTTHGLNGINILAGGAVHIEDCQIGTFSSTGISVNPSTAGAQIYVKNATIHNTTTGIAIAPTVAATVLVSNSHISNCPTGVSAGGKAKVLVNDTTVTGSTTAGFNCIATTANLTLIRCAASLNAVGIQASGPVTLAECAVLNNTGAGLKTLTGGKITSFTTSEVRGNTPDGAATVTATNR
jgi:hypothetical protein